LERLDVSSFSNLRWRRTRVHASSFFLLFFLLDFLNSVCTRKVAEFLARAVALALDVQAHLSAQDVPSKKLVDFVACLEDDDRGPFKEALQQLRSDVEAFAEGFPMPGPEVGGPLPL
jgi:hypothetical protein